MMNLRDSSIAAVETDSASVPSGPVLPAVARFVPAVVRAPAQQPDVPGRDWDGEFAALTVKLKQSVDVTPAPSSIPAQRGSSVHVRERVLDCVADLEQLHGSITQEQARHRQAAMAAATAEAALVQARAELVGTRARERRAQHLALHDGLTALPNRSHFRHRLDSALLGARLRRSRVAVMYLDLDGFKPINDTHGHQVGDELLRILAARLARAVRVEDMVSRVGGDEFACLIEGVGDHDALARMAGKLSRTVAAPVRIGVLQVKVSASIGISLCPDDGSTSEVLLSHADDAMYRAKSSQSGYAFFDRRIDP